MAIGALVGPAVAGTTFFQYARTDPGQNDAGGRVGAINATYNPTSNVFVWSATISNGATVDTDGFRLVVSPGPNPRTRADEYAMVYFDATTLAAPRVSVYRYNGLDRPPVGGAHPNESFVDPNDLLATNNQPSSGIVATASENGATRTFTVTIDATAINARYGAFNGWPEWRGLQFGQRLGYWFHPFRNGRTTYMGPMLTSLDWDGLGFVDASNEMTVEIPAPGAGGLVLIAGIAGLRRRRCAAATR